MIGTTITQFLIEEQRRFPSATGDLTSVINDIVTACKTIAAAMRYGAISDEELFGTAESENSQGEVQKRLDVIANRLFLRCTESGGHVAAMASEEMETIHQMPDENPEGRYLLLYDPVDGSYNINENATFGTIFSILKRPDVAAGRPTESEFLQSGIHQVCAGYAIYGPSCMIVMTTGNGTNGFTLDPLVGEFVLTNPSMTIDSSSSRICANIGWASQWEEPLGQYIADRMSGTGHFAGVYGMEWTGRRVVADLRQELFESYLQLPATFFDRFSAGQLISKLAYNSEQVAQAATHAVVSALREAWRLARLGPQRLCRVGPRDRVRACGAASARKAEEV